MSERVNSKIKELRKRQGLTLQQLSDLTNLSKGYLSKIESSDFVPRIQTLNKIAGALNADIGYFLEEYWMEKTKPQNIDLIKPPKVQRLPDIVTIAEAQRLFQATNTLSYRVFYFVI